MNEQIVKGKWNEFKGELLKTWGKLTGDEVDQAKGDIQSISGLIQQKYGSAKEDVGQRFNDMVSRYSDKIDEKSESIKDSLRDEPNKRIN